jgi:hypothetical protein
MRLAYDIQVAMISVKRGQEKMVLEGRCRKASVFGSGMGTFRMEITGSGVIDIAKHYGIDLSSTAVNIINRKLQGRKVEFMLEKSA